MKLSASIILFTILSLTSCAASQNGSEAPWRLELTTSGGITGSGSGNATVDSGGSVTIVSMQRKSCAFEAAAEELAPLAARVAAADPESWNDSYIPSNPCCDRIEYVLTVTRGEEKKTVRWIDDPLPLPADLKAVSDALNEIRRKYGERCR